MTFGKRPKNDAADTEAICEAAPRPTMRLVAVKSEDKQPTAMIFKVRILFVRQKSRATNTLRDHLAEFCIIGPKRTDHLGGLIRDVEASDTCLLKLF